MAIDLTNLSQTELLQLVNATPLGAVLTRSRLRRQMDAAAFRFGDGTHVHFVKYARWLVTEHDRPRTKPVDYAEAKKRQAARNRAATKASQDIYPIPEIEDIARRQAAGTSFRFFCETYFAKAFWRPWSDDHLKVLAKIEKAVREGGLFAFAMPRGSGKTALARAAALWAVLYGYRPFVCLIAGSQANAHELLRPMRMRILEEPLLLADFPEAVYPLRCLENSSKRQGQQHIQGNLTHVHWGQDRLVFPTMEEEHLPQALRDAGVEASPSSGSIITTTSLDAHLRGQQHTRVDGSIIRPSLVLLDDPQTRESARSTEQTKTRLDLLHGDVMGMAGPGESISALLTCTKMYEGDLADTLLDREKSPEWDSECTRLVYAFPTNDALWDQYAEIRRAQGRVVATEFYRRQRAEMDAGAVVAWPSRVDEKMGEISAIQNAMNLRLRMREQFNAECQNEPLQEQLHDLLTPEKVCQKVNGRPRGEVPLACSKITMFIDVHDKLLYWCVCAWQEDFTGFVIDYGTQPDQRRSWFTLDGAPHTLASKFRGVGVDAAIQAGLETLVSQFLNHEWQRAGAGGVLRIERCLVDMGYKPGIVAAVKHKVGGAAMILSKGVGIKAGSRPMSTYRRKPGEFHGLNWYFPNVRGTREFPHVATDVNWWKTFVHARLSVAPGDPGAMTLFGKSGDEHQLFAEHVAGSETWTLTHGHGRDVQEWKLKPQRPDNHFLDCLVGCAVAASIAGVKVPGAPAIRRAAAPRRGPRKAMFME